MEINASNINDAFVLGVELFKMSRWTRVVAPRGSATLEVTEPVVTSYARPTQRVLFSPARDANPFLHFFDSLWLLAGRRDVAFPALFSKRMREFSDDGEVLNGAYGWRWRHAYGYDQLEEVVALLKSDPDSRRAVLTMWHPKDLRDSHGPGVSRDVPCNTQVYLKLREGKLDIAVTCRSNDMLWGAYGANVVQFSVLQEYLAGKLGAAVGRYTQMSDSFHVYLPPHPAGVVWDRVARYYVSMVDPYSDFDGVAPFPLDAGHPDWDADMALFFRHVDAPDCGDHDIDIGFKTEFWHTVARPMWRAWLTRDASYLLNQCAARDWRLAGMEWLERRAGEDRATNLVRAYRSGY